MKIVSTASNYDIVSGKWIAKICNENAFRPLRIGFRSEVPIPKNTPTGPAINVSDLEVESVLNGLANGYQVRLVRTLCAPGSNGGYCRHVTSIDYENDNTDSIMTIYSETPDANDVLDFFVTSDLWPANFARVDFDRHERPVMFIGKTAEIGLHPSTFPRYAALPGGGFTVTHGDNFVVSTVLDEQVVTGGVHFFEVSQLPYTSANKHHIQPDTQHYLTFELTSDIARDIEIDSNGSIRFYSFDGGTTYVPFTGTNNTITVPAGTSSLRLSFNSTDLRPDSITFTDKLSAEVWTLSLIDYMPKIVLQYQTATGWAAFSPSAPGTYDLTEAIIPGSILSVLANNIEFGNSSSIIYTIRYCPVAGLPLLTYATNTIAPSYSYPLCPLAIPDSADAFTYVYNKFIGAMTVENIIGIQIKIDSSIAGMDYIINIPGDI